MSYSGQTAYITGGASGIARSLAGNLVDKRMKIVIADCNLDGAQKAAAELNGSGVIQSVWAVQVDVADWESQRKAFEFAAKTLGRIDYVFPIAGISEHPWLPKDLGSRTGAFEKPNLKVFEVNANGMLYSATLAVSLFRRQELNGQGFRGKVCSVASGCGFYYIPALPIYTASKHAVVGFTRAYGKVLIREYITLNTICPNIVATGISTSSFYEKAERKGLLITMNSLMGAFDYVMASEVSGEAIEILPGDDGFRIKKNSEFTDDLCRQSIELSRAPEHRAWKLHDPLTD